jgi:DNA ligase-4
MAHPSRGLVDFLIEDKLDGERCILHKRGDALQLFSRRPLDCTEQYGPLIRDVVMRGVRAENVILDGELLAYDTEAGKYIPFGENKTVANDELRGVAGKKQICFVVFDVLWVEKPEVKLDREGDMTQQPLSERRRLLDAILPPTGRVHGKLTVLQGQVVLASSKPGARARAVEARLNRAISERAEGIVVKALSSPYACHAREEFLWLKIKPEYTDGGHDTMDVLIVGAYRGTGSSGKPRAGNISSFVLAVADRSGVEGEGGAHAQVAKKWKTIGKVGTGYSMEELKSLREALRPCMVPFPRGEPVSKHAAYMSDWHPPNDARPDFLVSDPSKSIVLEVRASELQRAPTRTAAPVFSAGVTLRFPRVESIRLDKPPQAAATMQQVREILRSSQGKMSAAIQSAGPMTLTKRTRTTRLTLSQAAPKRASQVQGEWGLVCFACLCCANSLRCSASTGDAFNCAAAPDSGSVLVVLSRVMRWLRKGRCGCILWLVCRAAHARGRSGRGGCGV